MPGVSFGTDAKFTRYVSIFSGQEGRRMRVGRSVTASFCQISDAIRASRPHDCIEIESGKYFESLLVKHPLELCSTKDGEPPVIISRGPCLKIITEGPVRLHSLVIVAKGTKESDSQGIVIERGNPLIEECEISSVYVMNNASPQILHCHICNSDYGHGLCLSGNSGGVYVNNDISYHNDHCMHINTEGKPNIHHNCISQKKGQKNIAVLISGRLLNSCEPFFMENIIRGGCGVGGYSNDEGSLEGHSEVDPLSVYSPEMLRQRKLTGFASLVSVTDGAMPFIRGNLLSNGVTGFFFGRCRLPPDRFCDNRVMNCTAWGIVVAEKVSLVVQNNDVQYCGGGISVFSSNRGAASGATSYCVTLNRCHVLKNVNYGVLFDRSVVTLSECNISENSVGIALLGNCASSVITKNTLSGNTVAAFSVLHCGVAVVENNIIYGTATSKYGFFIQGGSIVTLKSNNVEGVATSILVREKSQLVAVNNKLHKASVHHVLLSGGSELTLQKNIMEGSTYASVVITEKSKCTACENMMLSGSMEGFLVEANGKATIEHNSMSSLREAVYVKSCGFVHLEDNDVTLSQNCVIVEGRNSKCTAIGNRFRSIREIAIYAFDYANVNISGNSMTNILGAGIQIGLGAKAIIQNNNFTGLGDAAIHVDGAETECDVVNCRMDDVGFGVRYTRGCTGVIRGNQISRCKNAAVTCNTNASLSLYENKISESCKGVELYFADDVYNNIIDDCAVGILAALSSVAKVRDHTITNCTVGVSLMSQTCVSFTAITVKKSKEFGFLVAGPCAAVIVKHTTLEDCGVAGVFVQEKGECRFEQCILRRNREEGLLLQNAGAVVFEQCRIFDHTCGVKVTRSHGAAQTAGRPLLVNCIIDGDTCEEGVLIADGGIVGVDHCTINARCPQKGCGVIVHDNGTAWLSHCDVSSCPRVGVEAFPCSALRMEHSTIENCGIGALFASAKDNKNCIEGTQVSHSGCFDKLSKDDGNTAVTSRLSRLTIKGCSEAGILYEDYGRGVVDSVSVFECYTGIILRRGSHVVLTSTILRGSIYCGFLLRGPLSRGSLLAHISINDSEEYGVMVEHGVNDHTDADVNAVDGDDVSFLTFDDFEVLGSGKCGALIEASVCLNGCKFDNNTAVGVICQGVACRAVLSRCRLSRSSDANLETRQGSLPELRDCVVEDAPVGVRVRSALSMAHCVARHLGIAVDLFAVTVGSAASLRALECVFSNNETGILCAGNVDKSEPSSVIIEKCAFNEISSIGVCVTNGSPQVLLKNCDFEMSCEGVKVGEAAVTVFETCGFRRNMKAITLADVKEVEVKNSFFFTQTHHAISVTGNSGVVRICNNNFNENCRHGVTLFAKGVESVLVHENKFESDVCGIFIQETPQAYVYNNCFNACDTGILLSGEGFCGNIFSNKVAQGTCGCCIEKNSTAHLWRNEFTENREYGVFSTDGAKPVVINNTFAHHNAEKSVALCVCDGGAGHFAFNQFFQNVCGVYLQTSGNDVVILNNSTFDANKIAICLRKGAAAHILACTFASSLSSDISAVGLIEEGKCVLAYNCFASKHCGAVVVGEKSTIVVYRSIFLGDCGRGVVQQRHGNSLVYECFFYELDCGVCAEESGKGDVNSCMFVRCMMAVRVCSLASTVFRSCFFLAPPGDVPELVVVHHAANAKFLKCFFIGCLGMKTPLLESSGGGSVEGSSFFAGKIAVVLEKDCKMLLRQNTFFRGGIGLRFNALSAAKAENNTFYEHAVAAVSLMDNAGGELSENMFAQMPESGGVMTGAHNVTLGAYKSFEGSRLSKEAKRMNEKSLEFDIITTFVTYISQTPYCMRQGMCSTQHVAALPQPILTALNEPCEVVTHSNMEQGQDTGIANTTYEVKQTTDERDVLLTKNKSPNPQQRGANALNKKKGKKKASLKVFTFVVDEATFSTPQGIQDNLLLWVDQQGVTLSLNEIQQGHTFLKDTELVASVADVLHGASQSLTITEHNAQNVQKRGDFADSQHDVIRGATAHFAVSLSGDTKTSLRHVVDTASEKELRDLSVAQMSDSVRSSIPTLPLHHPRLSESGDSLKKPHEKKPAVWKRRKAIEPPLRSKGKNAGRAHGCSHRPWRTFAGCLRACVAECHHKSKKRSLQENLGTAVGGTKKHAIFKREDNSSILPLNKNDEGTSSEGMDVVGNDREHLFQNGGSNLSDVSLSISCQSRAIERTEDSRWGGKEKPSISCEDGETSCKGSKERKINESSNSKSCSHVFEDESSKVDLNDVGGGGGDWTNTETCMEEEEGISDLAYFTVKNASKGESKQSNHSCVGASAVGGNVGFEDSYHSILLPDDKSSKDGAALLAGKRSNKVRPFENIVLESNSDTLDNCFCYGSGRAKIKKNMRYKIDSKLLERQGGGLEPTDASTGDLTLLSQSLGGRKDASLRGRALFNGLEDSIEMLEISTNVAKPFLSDCILPDNGKTVSSFCSDKLSFSVADGERASNVLQSNTSRTAIAQSTEYHEKEATSKFLLPVSSFVSTANEADQSVSHLVANQHKDAIGSANIHNSTTPTVTGSGFDAVPKDALTLAECKLSIEGANKGRDVLESPCLFPHPTGLPPKRCKTATPSQPLARKVVTTLKSQNDPGKNGGSLLTTSESQSVVSSTFLGSHGTMTEGNPKDQNLSYFVSYIPSDHEPSIAAYISDDTKARKIPAAKKSPRDKRQKNLYTFEGKKGSFHLPKMATSFLSYTHKSIQSSMKSTTTGEKFVVPALSKKGLLLLNALGDTALQGNVFLQAEVRAATERCRGKKSLTSDESVVVKPLHDAILATFGGTIATERKVKKEKEILPVEIEAEELMEEDPKEAIEDIISILRWLADMREQKLLSNQLFTVAVECIRKKSNVSFFFSEGDKAGTEPTLIVRLPQTADETVVVPLLGAPIDTMDFVWPEDKESEVVSNVQLRKPTLGSLKGVCTTDVKPIKQGLWFVGKERGKRGENEELQKKSCEAFSGGGGGAKCGEAMQKRCMHHLSSNVGKHPLHFVRSKWPHNNFKWDRHDSLTTNSALNALQLSHASLLASNTKKTLRSNLTVVNLANKGTLECSKASMQNSSVTTSKNTSPQSVPRFNPAIPFETSPFNRTPMVATFIASGTTNLRM